MTQQEIEEMAKQLADEYIEKTKDEQLASDRWYECYIYEKNNLLKQIQL